MQDEKTQQLLFTALCERVMALESWRKETECQRNNGESDAQRKLAKKE